PLGRVLPSEQRDRLAKVSERWVLSMMARSFRTRAEMVNRQWEGSGGALPIRPWPGSDPPPVKWSTLSYGFAHKGGCNAEEELQAGGDWREAAPGRCSDVARPERGRGDPLDRGQRGDVLPLATRVRWPEERSD